jgi:tetratricopeptide (TPR) repeat protein
MSLTTASTTAETHFREALDHLNNVEFVAAREAADEALANDADFALALLVRGLTSETFADGQSYIEKAKAQRSAVTPGERHFIDAIVARRAGDMKTMTTAVKALAKAHPRDPDALFMLGQMHFSMRNAEKTKETFDTLLEVDPTYGAAYNLLGYRALNEGNHDEAESMFKKYVELRPDAPNPYDSLAEYYLKVGTYDKAVANYKKAYEKDPRYVSAWTRAGLVMAMKGDAEKAEAEIRKALVTAQDAEDKVAAYDALANAALLNDDVERALSVLDEASIWATTAAPERVSYFKMGEGWVLYEHGRLREAEEVQRAVQTMIDDEAAFDDELRPYVASRAMMARAFLAIEKEDLTAAKKELQAFEAYANETGNPGDVEVLHELKGTLAYKQGAYEKALTHYTQAGDDPHIQYRAGMASKKLGDTEQARMYFEKAAKANQPSRSFALIRNRAMEEM